MNVHGHAAPIVGNLQRAILVEGDVDSLAVARKRLVDTVVDDLVRKMIRPRGVCVHARPAAHGLEAAEDLDVRSGIGMAHRSRRRKVRASARPRPSGPRAILQNVESLSASQAKSASNAERVASGTVETS